jgi:hypothetical protein
MDRFPLDRFSSSSHLPMPPPSQSAFRTSDEHDPFKISFLKGPKRKRLAKVPISLIVYTLTTPLISSNRLVMPATRASDDVMVPVSLHFLPSYPWFAA